MTATSPYLKPGDRLFGDGGQRALKTVVGACVAVTVRHPQRRGGEQGRYGREALSDPVREIHRRNLGPRHRHVTPEPATGGVAVRRQSAGE